MLLLNLIVDQSMLHGPSTGTTSLSPGECFRSMVGFGESLTNQSILGPLTTSDARLRRWLGCGSQSSSRTGGWIWQV